MSLSASGGTAVKPPAEVAGLDRHLRGPRLVRTLTMDDCPHDGQTDGRAGDTMTGDPAAGPLAGLLVADFSRILAGPYATMLLADMGAEVVKVEGPGGDDTRTWQPPGREGGTHSSLGAHT